MMHGLTPYVAGIKTSTPHIPHTSLDKSLSRDGQRDI